MFYFFLISAVIVLGGYLYYSYFLAKKFDPTLRAEQYLKNNQTKEAVYEYRKLLDRDPFDFVTLYRLAELHNRLGEYDDAAEYYDKILSINKYNYEVEKVKVIGALARIYALRNDTENCYRQYNELLKLHPTDETALYNCAFIALGQEEYDIALRFFERYLKIAKPGFDALFGAGICYYQNQKTAEAVGMFKSALEKNPDSDITNLALAFSHRRKRDFRKAIPYVEKLVLMIEDPDILFTVMRFDAFLNAHLKRTKEAVSKFESVLAYVRKNSLMEEELLTLFDLGYALIMDEQTGKAYEYWNRLAERDRNYRNISTLIMQLRREMNDEAGSKTPDSVSGNVEAWLENAFPPDFLWGICGLKAAVAFDVKSITALPRSGSVDRGADAAADYEDDSIKAFMGVDGEKFRMVSSRVLEKLGVKVHEFLNTYRELDGVDIIGLEKATGERVYVWVRRWKQTKVGEIPLRNFAQAVNDNKAKAGLFITTAELTESAAAAAERLSKVQVVGPEELNRMLQGLL